MTNSQRQDRLRQLSHDLRESLYVISTSAQVLQGITQDADVYQRTVEYLQQESTKAQRLAAELIELARDATQ